MTASHINPEMQAAVGQQLGRRVSFPVSESDIRRWALAVYWPEEPPRLYWDAGYAKNTHHGGIVAPEDFNPFAWMVADQEAPDVELETNDPNRMEKILGVDGPGVKFQLNGGMEVDYGVRMRPDDVITSVSRLAQYHEREGRLGLMLFTVTEDVWSNQDDDEVKRTRSTLIRY
jgi:hypothetical protein